MVGNPVSRRSVLRTSGVVGASVVGATGAGSTGGPATALVDGEVRVWGDYRISDGDLATIVDHLDAELGRLDASFDCRHHGHVSQNSVLSRTDADGDAALYRFDSWIEETVGRQAGRIDVWVYDRDCWLAGSGTAFGMGAAVRGGGARPGRTDLRPTAVAGHTWDGESRNLADVAGTVTHELGHLLVHPDHDHHRMYTWEGTAGDVTRTAMYDGEADCDATDNRVDRPLDANQLGPLAVAAADEFVYRGEALSGLAECFYE